MAKLSWYAREDLSSRARSLSTRCQVTDHVAAKSIQDKAMTPSRGRLQSFVFRFFGFCQKRLRAGTVTWNFLARIKLKLCFHFVTVALRHSLANELPVNL